MQQTIERLSHLYENEIAEMLKHLTYQLRPTIEADQQIVRQAVAIVRQGQVNQLSLRDEGTTLSIELISYRVTFHLDKMTLNCQCERPLCEHQLAFILYLYAPLHSLTEWLRKWRESRVEQLSLSISERTPAAWSTALHALTRSLRSIDSDQHSSSFFIANKEIEQQALALAPYEWEWKPIFELYFRLHVLEAAFDHLTTVLDDTAIRFSYTQWQYRNWLEEQLSKVEAIVTTLGSKPQLFETDVFFTAIHQFIQQIVYRSPFLFAERTNLFFICWQHLFRNRSLRAAEVLTLQQQQHAESPTFLALLYWLQKDYEQLTIVVSDLKVADVPNWIVVAQIGSKFDDAQALTIVLQALYPKLIPFFQSNTFIGERHTFIMQVHQLLEKASFPDELQEQLFLQYGQIGVPFYAEFLRRRERYQEWVALLHRFQMSFDSIEPDFLKEVMSKDPVTILPLFHHYAMQLIEEKNRNSYRRAVRFLKRMKTAAKKSGKTAFWNNYIDSMRQRHRRLRAFTEEMDKGNLRL